MSMAEYVYKEKSYKVVAAGKMKHRQTRKWLPAVIYQNEGGEVFIREQGEFYAKFHLKG